MPWAKQKCAREGRGKELPSIRVLVRTYTVLVVHALAFVVIAICSRSFFVSTAVPPTIAIGRSDITSTPPQPKTHYNGAMHTPAQTTAARIALIAAFSPALEWPQWPTQDRRPSRYVVLRILPGGAPLSTRYARELLEQEQVPTHDTTMPEQAFSASPCLSHQNHLGGTALVSRVWQAREHRGSLSSAGYRGVRLFGYTPRSSNRYGKL